MLCTFDDEQQFCSTFTRHLDVYYLMSKYKCNKNLKNHLFLRNEL